MKNSIGSRNVPADDFSILSNQNYVGVPFAERVARTADLIPIYAVFLIGEASRLGSAPVHHSELVVARQFIPFKDFIVSDDMIVDHVSQDSFFFGSEFFALQVDFEGIFRESECLVGWGKQRVTIVCHL